MMTAREATYDALVRDDVVAFEKLLDQQPQLQTHDRGVFYLVHACNRGRFGIVQALVRRGVDVNAVRDNENDPEGAVVSAADSGHLEVTRWMLDQGALVNYVVGGKTRCFALTGAVVGGYINVVKLLVERGADVNATGGRTTPLGYAVGFNQPEIADYLRSVGAKLPDELPK